MNLLAVLAFFVVLAQTTAPPTNPPVSTDPNAVALGSPRAPAPSGQTQGRTQLTVQDLPPAKEYATYLYDVAGSFVADNLDKGGMNFTNTIWTLPDFILSSRSPENTVDWGPSAELNDTLVKQLIGLVLLAMALVVGHHMTCLLRGEAPNPLVAMLAVVGVGLFALAAMYNRTLQQLPVGLADLVLRTIAGAPVRDVVKPAFHLSSMADSFWAGLVLLGMVIATLLLTAVLFVESAAVITLGTLVGIALLGLPVPIFGSGCQYIVRRWLGSLFSPVICFTALRLAAPSLERVTNAPDILTQLMTIALLWFAWQAPGLMIAAVSVPFPSVASWYYASRLFGQGRVSERLIQRGGSGSDRGGDDEGGRRTRRNPPRRVSGGFGGGNGRNATRKWMPAT